MALNTVRIKGILLAVIFTVFSSSPAIAAPSSSGTEFWLSFPGSVHSDGTSPVTAPIKTIMLTSSVNTTATIYIPGLLNQAYAVTAGAIRYVNLPWNSDVWENDAVTSKGIHVTCPDPITVYGMSHTLTITDAFLGLPVDALGTNYIVQAYGNGGVDNPWGSEFTVVAAQDGTTVTITPSCDTGARLSGVPYTVPLNEGQTYLLRNDTGTSGFDMAGTLVDSDKPIAVFGAHACGDVPIAYMYCDYLIEQLQPTSSWGMQFILIPLAGRTGGDTYRMIASNDSTNISLDGAPLVSINRGDYFEAVISGAGMITSDKRINVMQYANSNDFDGNTGDPFMMTIEPVEQYLTDYTVGTPQSGFAYNYLNIAVPDAAVGLVSVDGTLIGAVGYTTIAGSGYSVTRVLVGLGPHNINSPLKCGVSVYGFDWRDGYGYPGGSGAIDFVSTLTSTVTPTLTRTFTRTASPTRTDTRTMTPTRTPTFTISPSPGGTFTITPTDTVSPTITITVIPTETVSNTVTMTPSETHTQSMTLTATDSVTRTISPTRTATATFTPSMTPTMTWSTTFTATMTLTFTGTFTRSMTLTATLTSTNTPTRTITDTITPTQTITVTRTVTNTPTITMTPADTQTPTPTPPALVLELKGNYPNPFKDDTNIVYWLSRDAIVRIRIFTVSAEVVVTESEIQARAGYNSFYWNGNNRSGRHIASGVFIYRVNAATDLGESQSGYGKLVCVR